MDKKLYAKMLMQRYEYMEYVNDEGKKKAAEIRNKIQELPEESRHAFRNRLTTEERNIYYSDGRIYSYAAFKRIRTELNKVLIEIEKGE